MVIMTIISSLAFFLSQQPLFKIPPSQKKDEFFNSSDLDIDTCSQKIRTTLPK